MDIVLSALGICGTCHVETLVLVGEGSKLGAIGTIAGGRRRGLGAGRQFRRATFPLSRAERIESEMCHR